MIEKEKINHIEHLVAPDKAAEFFSFFKNIIDKTEYKFVRLKISGKEELNIQIMAEDKNKSMVIEDCKMLSNIIVDEIDLADDFNYDYVLEVSSPGIDRPLTCEEDFNFWVGNEVFVKLKKPINKTKKITGILKGIFNNNIKLEDINGDNVLEIEVDNIRDINIIWSPEVTNLN
ncbi:MAG: ribosome maturation factor RimP [Alphaproteobacteria bacterium]